MGKVRYKKALFYSFIFTGLLVVILVALYTFKYFQRASSLKPSLARKTGRGIAVKTAKAEIQQLVETIGCYGKLSSRRMVDIACPMSQPVRVTKVHVIEGQYVSKGKILFEFDEEALKCLLRKANDQISELNARIKLFHHQQSLRREELRYKVSVLESEILAAKQALKVARMVYENTRELFAKKLSYEREVEEAKEGFEKAMSRVRSKEYELRVVKNEIATFQDNYDSELSKLTAEKSKALNERLMALTQYKCRKVRSPVDGVLTGLYISNGQYVGSAKKLATVADKRFPCFIGMVSAMKGNVIKERMRAEIIFDDFPQTVLKGEVVSVGQTVDKETKVFEVVIAFDEFIKIPFKIGMEGFARIKSTRKVLAIPSIAIINPAGNPMVFVVEDGKVYHRRVQLGAIVGGKAEILGGLNQGEEVVYYGQERLREGDLVNTCFYN